MEIPIETTITTVTVYPDRARVTCRGRAEVAPGQHQLIVGELPLVLEPESVRVEHATGFIFQSAECVSAAQMDVNIGELKFSWPDKAAFVTQIRYSN